MPQPDYFGLCDHFKAPSFLTDINPPQTCFLKVKNLENACANFFDARKFANTITYLKGSKSDSSTATVTLGNIYLLNSKDQTIS